MEIKSVVLTLLGCIALALLPGSEQCTLGLEKKWVCDGSSQPTCDDVNSHGSLNDDCNKHLACRCPDSAPYRWGSQCYKDFECPQKSLDAPSNNRTGHNFVVPGTLRNDGLMYGMHISALKLPAHWYHAIALFQIQDPACIAAAQKAQADNPTTFLSINYRVPTKLVDLLVKGNTFTANIGLNAGPAFQFVKQCGLKVVDVLDLRRYKADQRPYPQFQKYFLFGNSREAFISHLPTRCYDFQQLVSLKSAPSGLSDYQLRRGIVIEIPALGGQPTFNSNNYIVDPLTGSNYDVILTGGNGNMMQVSIGRKETFDFFIINIGC